jgi:hypothetical protein
MCCNSVQNEHLTLNFNDSFFINDSLLIKNINAYIHVVDEKNINKTNEFRFWEIFILHATAEYSRVIVKRCNYELLSTATGYFAVGKNIFFLHTGLELIAEKDTTFVYNIVNSNTKEKYKFINDFKIPPKDSSFTREFVRFADTILINYTY